MLYKWDFKITDFNQSTNKMSIYIFIYHYLKHLVNDRSTGGQPIDHLYNYLRWRQIYTLGIKEWPCLLCEKLRKEMYQKERHATSINNAVGAQYELKTPELCTSWPKLDFGGGE